MKKSLNLSIIFALSILISFSSVLAAKLIKITDADLKSNTLILQHTSLGDVAFKKRVYDNPPRLVFDILNSDLDGSKKTFKPVASEITEVRVGQFEPTVVRIVMQGSTVSSLEKVTVENVGQRIYFKLGAEDVAVEDISFEGGDIVVEANNSINHRRIELSDPERLVVDLLGARLTDSKLKQTYKNGDEEIRTSQFEKSTVRIVFAGPDSTKRKVELEDDGRVLIIQGKDNEKKRIEKRRLRDKIEGLTLLEKSKTESIFLVEASKPFEYKFLKLHKPERLVVDVFGVAFEEELYATQFKETEHVKDVRFGLASAGTPVTRIVFDLKSNSLDYDFSLNDKSNELRIKIKGKVADDPDLPLAQKSVGRKVVIDPGHGGYDPGAMYGGYNEKDITLGISKKLKSYLEKAGIKAYITRSNDRFLSLAERVEISNSIKPAMFVSVHVNALATNTNMTGLQTYYYSTGGLKIAKVVHNQLLQDVKMTNGNIRRARFWVTKYTAAPAILSELGFMTNAGERKKLASNSYQDELAKSLARGIIKYLESL